MSLLPENSSVTDLNCTHSSDLPSGNNTRSSRRFKALRIVARAISSKPKSHWLLLVVSTTITFVSLVASSILPRSYYRNSEQNWWIISWFTSAAWPLAALLLLPFLTFPSASPVFSLRLLWWYAALGLLTVLSNSIFAGIYNIPWGWEWKHGTGETPVSSFHGATTVVFGVALGRWFAGNKVRAWKVNAAFVALVGALAVAYEFTKEDNGSAGTFFGMMLLLDLPVSALRGAVLAFTERVVKQRMRGGEGVAATPVAAVTVRVALEVQLMISIFAFASSSIVFFVKAGFGKLKSEGKRFEGGERSYYMILVWSSIAFQLLAVGGAMLVALSSTVFASMLGSARLPVTSLIAIAFFPDPMTAYKLLGLVLGVWAVACYGFGSLKF